MRSPTFINNFWNKIWNRKTPSSQPTTLPVKIHELTKSSPKPKTLIESFWLRSPKFKCSSQKLSLLANQITQMKLLDAINQMQLSPKKASRKVYGLLMRVKNHINTNSIILPSEYYVRQATIGRGKYKKEIDFKAKGRFGIIQHPNSFIRVEIAQWAPLENLAKQLRKVISKAKEPAYSENRKVSAKINY